MSFHQQRLESQLSCELLAVRLLSLDAQKIILGAWGSVKFSSINEINSLLIPFIIAIRFYFKYLGGFIETLKFIHCPCNSQYTCHSNVLQEFPISKLCYILLHLLFALN